MRAIRQATGAWITRAREMAGYDRRAVASRMGYRNVDRGMSKLARWERGDDAVRGDRIPVLAAALGRPPAALTRFARKEQAALEAAELDVRRRRDADRRALDAEWWLLARCTVPLLVRLHRDLSLDQVPDVVLRSTGWSIMLMGGGHFSLRSLLRAWRSGLLTVPCRCCGGPLLLTWVSGSPFSGAHRLAGICESTGQYRTTSMPSAESITGLVGPVVDVDRKAAAQQSQAGPRQRYDITLAEALGAFGFEVMQVRLRDRAGKVMGLYDPRSGIISDLTPSGRSHRAEEAQVAHSIQVVTRRGPAREGRRPMIGSLAPLTFGTWQGDAVELVDEAGGTWRLHPGYLEDPEMQVAAWFDAPVPPIVALWVIGRTQPIGTETVEVLP